MRTPIVLGLLTAAATASASPPIIGGELETGQPGTVLLVAYPANHSTLFTCTAVVIGPRLLLTAAHCVDHPGFTYGVFYGADATPFDTLDKLIPELAPVFAAQFHPSYNRSPPFTADIAVVRLVEDVPSSITPHAIARTPPTAAMVGLDVTIVGFGQVTPGTFNAAKHSAITTIAALDPDDTILIGNASTRTCVGDSGGPVLLDGVVLGVDSYSDTTGCGDPAHFRRTDAYLPFIDEFLDAPPPDDDAPPPVDDEPADSGGCSTGGSTSGLFALALLALLLRRR